MSIGDLANGVARTLYEQRVAVAILGAVGLVALAMVARRLGWIGAARRHPRRTGSLVAAMLAVGMPVAWYLGSPIFLRTSLVEVLPGSVPSPAASVAPAAAASTPGSTPVASASAAPANPTPAPTVAPFVPATIASGAFTGTDDFHFGRGTASLIELAPGRFHLRLDQFSVRNGPDLYVYLSPSPDGWTEAALEVGRLKATDGSFGYDLPAGIDPAVYRSAIIWCKQFSHLFATAPFAA